MKSYLFLALLCACGGTASAGPAFPICPPSQTAAPVRTISVTGTATLDVTPDTLDVQMGITSEAARPKSAVDGLRARQAIFAKAIAPLKVETHLSEISLSPRWDEHGNVIGYVATLGVHVSTKDFDLIGDIAEAGASANATGITTSFHRSDLPAQKAHLRALALEAAKAKASQTAETLGFGIGPVQSVEENVGEGWYGGVGVANAVNNETVRPSGDVNPDATSMTLTIGVVYQIT